MAWVRKIITSVMSVFGVQQRAFEEEENISGTETLQTSDYTGISNSTLFLSHSFLWNNCGNLKN